MNPKGKPLEPVVATCFQCKGGSRAPLPRWECDGKIYTMHQPCVGAYMMLHPSESVYFTSAEADV